MVRGQTRSFQARNKSLPSSRLRDQDLYDPRHGEQRTQKLWHASAENEDHSLPSCGSQTARSESTSVPRPVGWRQALGIVKEEKMAILTAKDVRSRYEKKTEAYLRDNAAPMLPDSDLVSLNQIHDHWFRSMIAESDPWSLVQIHDRCFTSMIAESDLWSLTEIHAPWFRSMIADSDSWSLIGSNWLSLSRRRFLQSVDSL